MRFMTLLTALTFLIGGLLSTGCNKSGKSGGGEGEKKILSTDPSVFPITAGKYTILGILTDAKDHGRAKANAEDTLTKYPNIKCMVGLWAYNPPQILLAVEAAGKEDQVKIVGFDEHEDTLVAISSGKIHGTIVQNPFAFGYKSVEYLAAMARDQKFDIPDDGIMTIPFDVLRKDNVDAFSVIVKNRLAGTGTPPKHARDDYDTTSKVRVCFLTNSVDPFWTLARKGCELAAPAFNAECKVIEPPNGTVDEQKRYIEDIITDKYQGLAISPIDPKNQGDMINTACKVMPVICQDSDAPDTMRKFYLGTSNYKAGRAAGVLVKEAIPDGGDVMIFVGKMEVLNAQERSQGLIDELLGLPE